MSRNLAVRAHAKINLDLRVLGRRPDGYHDLRTIFQSVALHDTLTILPARGPLAIACNDPTVPCDSSNLVWRAADALWHNAGRGGIPAGVRVRILKRIPPQSGLGGGSSDAAAALVALDAWWGLRTPPARLFELAATLGSDVPFFLVGGTVLGLGRGEQVYALPDLEPLVVVIVRPPFGVSTADAYGWMESGDDGRLHGPGRAEALRHVPRRAEALPHVRRIERIVLPGHPVGVEAANDLERGVFARHPGLARARDDLRRAGAAVALMSGSGSVVFGLFTDRPQAARALARLRGPGWTGVLTRTIGRDAARPRVRHVNR